MTRLLTLVVLALVLVSTQVEARSKRIHVTVKIVQQTFTGDLASPNLGDQLISSVDLFDKNDDKVGTGAGFCTVVSVPQPAGDGETLLQCLLSAVFDKKGQIIFGGILPPPAVGAVGHLGVFGGTDDFRSARGEVTLVVIAPDLTQEATLDLEIDSERRHGKFED
jgi:hypothetical protein